MTTDLDPKSFRRAMLAYARASDEYARLKQQTLAEIRDLTAREGAYVSYSGGKDSLVLLHLAATARPDITVYHWDHGPYLMPRPVEQAIVEAARRIAPQARMIVRSAPSLWDPAARWDYHRWYRAFYASLEELVAREGLRIALLGLRAEESVSRRLRVRERCRETRIQVECYPLRSWTWRDVWAYIFEHNLPYPYTYNQYCPLLGWDKCRLVTFHDEEFKHLGGNLDGILMWQYKNTGGGLWRRP